eukprot:4837342-Prymnesium_polylepis.1
MPSESSIGKSAGGRDLDAGKSCCEKDAAGMSACATGLAWPICSGMHAMPRSRCTSSCAAHGPTALSIEG